MYQKPNLSMIRPLCKKLLLSLVISTLLTQPNHVAFADDLPSIGTVASATLSIDQEKIYGDVYMRTIRAHQPVISDPVLNEYISSLGHRLVASANDVRTPFTFFLIKNREINAFAFFGGYVALHSGLFLHTKTESELASVMAHEIAHITQRHLARSIEAQAKRSPATMAAMAGSILLAIAAPEAGIAAMTATSAGTMQSQINYTRANEKEADSFGIATLAKAGFNPEAMPNFFSKLADEYRYASTPPAMLQTHPLPESRITDSRMRADSYTATQPSTSLNFQLAKVRVITRYTGLPEVQAKDWLERQHKKGYLLDDAYQYGLALLELDNNNSADAEKRLSSLIADAPLNTFYLDAQSDVFLAQNTPKQAIGMLETAIKQSPGNSVLTINLANCMYHADDPDKAIRLLQRYTHDHPNDTNGWQLLAEINAKQGNEAEELAARAELVALHADWGKAIHYYSEASQIAPLGGPMQARYDARIDELILKRQQMADIEN